MALVLARGDGAYGSGDAGWRGGRSCAVRGSEVSGVESLKPGRRALARRSACLQGREA